MLQPSAMEFVAFDIESTGLIPFQERLVELAAVRFRIVGDSVDEIAVFQELVNPTIPIPEAASKVHRIFDHDVQEKPLACEVLQRFVKFLGPDTPLIAHNAEFDRDFVGAELHIAGLGLLPNPIFDTLAMSRGLVTGIMNHRLETLVHHFALPVRDFHRAEDDARYLVKLSGHFARLSGGVDSLLKRFPPTSFSEVKRLLDVRLGLAHAQINLALKRQAVLNFEYEEGGQKRTVRIRPRLVFRADKIDSILGQDMVSEQTKSFRLDRISKPRCEIS